jgi:ABC-type dipeptide/oligopeptide/nickel transport system permease subunit
MNAMTRILRWPFAFDEPAVQRLDRGFWRRLWGHRSARFGLLLSALLMLVAAAGPFIAPQEPNWPRYALALKAPAADYWLGTDATGRDVLSRILDGAHRSLGAAIAVVACLFAIGLLVGTIAGLVGGVLDMVLMRLVDLLMALPGTVLAFAILGVLGPGFQNLLLALVVADWAYYARLSRSYVLTARQRPDVIAARMAGIPGWRILTGHIIPGVAAQLAVVASLGLGGMIGAISGFSFLGLGVQPPYAEWGAMLSESRFYFPIAPWLLLAPAGMILLSVLAANFVGNGVRDVLNPRFTR